MATVLQMKHMGVLDQVSQATKKNNRLAFVIGALLGGFIPIASYTICHVECPTKPVLWVLVAAGFSYSAFTVFQWARVAFKHPAKAGGFVILTEGILLFSDIRWLSITGLVILVIINGIATATNLIADRRQSRKRK